MFMLELSLSSFSLFLCAQNSLPKYEYFTLHIYLEKKNNPVNAPG